MSKTQFRNARRRERNRLVKAAQRELAKEAGVQRPRPTVSAPGGTGGKLPQSAHAKAQIEQDPGTTAPNATGPPAAEATAGTSILAQSPSQAAVARPTPNSNALPQQDNLFEMLHPGSAIPLNNPVGLLQSLGNGKKARSLRKQLAKGKGSFVPGPSKVVFAEDGQAEALAVPSPVADPDADTVHQAQAPAVAADPGSAVAVQAAATSFAASSSSLARLTSQELSQLADLSSGPITPAASSQPTLAGQAKRPQGSINAKRPPPPPPSMRSDLPANVIVTSVDVERADWVPGEHTANFVAPVQYPSQYHAQSQIQGSTADAPAVDAVISTYGPTPFGNGSASMSIQGGSAKPLSKRAAKKAAAAARKKQQAGEKGAALHAPIAAPYGVYSQGSKIADASDLGQLEADGWAGWPADLDAVQAGFDTWPKVNAPGDGERVAVKILELSETSYMPELSTYYGVVLSLDSDPSGSSSIRLKLHPSCRPSAVASISDNGEGWDDGRYGDGDEYRDEGAHEALYGTTEGGRRKFGEDMLLQEEGDGVTSSSGADDEKEIALDEIVDCRRLSLRVVLQR